MTCSLTNWFLGVILRIGQHWLLCATSVAVRKNKKQTRTEHQENDWVLLYFQNGTDLLYTCARKKQMNVLPTKVPQDSILDFTACLKSTDREKNRKVKKGNFRANFCLRPRARSWEGLRSKLSWVRGVDFTQVQKPRIYMCYILAKK